MQVYDYLSAPSGAKDIRLIAIRKGDTSIIRHYWIISQTITEGILSDIIAVFKRETGIENSWTVKAKPTGLSRI